MSRVVVLPLLLAACTVPAWTPDPADDDDTDVVVDTEVTDTEVDAVDTADTYFDVDPGNDSADPGLDTDSLQQLGCHPWEPVDSTGWTRRYRVTYGTDTGNEVHTGAGWVDMPTAWAGAVPAGWAYDLTVNAGTSSATGRYWVACDVGSPGAYDIGWRRSTTGFGAVTVKAGANRARLYLPSDADILTDRVGWTNTRMTYDLTTSGGIIPVPGAARLVHNDQAVVGFGMEQVTVPAGTFDAYKINYIYDASQEAASGGNGFLSIFQNLFLGIFSQLFGAGASNESVTAQANRWYVRGVGMVKEETFDYTTGELIVRKELSNCSGLPGCP